MCSEPLGHKNNYNHKQKLDADELKSQWVMEETQQRPLADKEPRQRIKLREEEGGIQFDV